MKRKLSPWCKAVKIAMIQKDWGVADLAQADWNVGGVHEREKARLPPCQVD